MGDSGLEVLFWGENALPKAKKLTIYRHLSFIINIISRPDPKTTPQNVPKRIALKYN
jgi:hypothetical protein